MLFASPALRRACGVLLVGAAAMSLAACATKPKPIAPPIAPPERPLPPPPEPAPTPRPPPPVQTPLPPPTPSRPNPGSAADFQVTAGDRVYFDYDSYTVRADAKPVLDAQAAWLARYPGVQIRIDGNADERGTEEYNFALGARRANAVRDYLVSRGVAASRIETVSYGKSRPIDPRSNEDGWAVNRNGHTAITAGAR